MTASVVEAPEITVSIVSMNNLAYLRRCLESMDRHHRGLAIETIVVLYRTPPERVQEIAAEFPHVQIVVSGDDETRGYAENQNLGLRRGRGTYHVILNDDIIFVDDALKKLRDYHRAHPDVAALLPKLLNEDGSLQVGLRGRLTPISFALYLLHLNGILSRHPALRPLLFDAPAYDATEPVEAHAGSGAFFWVSTGVLHEVGFMDERFFLAPDDIDLSIRIERAGFKIVYLPDVAAIHTGSTTLSKLFSRVLPVNLHGVIELFDVHYGWAASTLTKGSVGAASLGSALYWGLKWLGGDRKRAPTMLRGRLNVLRFLLPPRRSTKEIFQRSW